MAKRGELRMGVGLRVGIVGIELKMGIELRVGKEE